MNKNPAISDQESAVFCLRQGYGGHVGLQPSATRNPQSKGFTLMELLVVLAIIGLLTGMLFPALMGARERAKVTRARAEVNQLQQAWLSYWVTYRTWPGGTGVIQMNEENVKKLSGDNPYGIRFMNFDNRQLAFGFLDPWWNGRSGTIETHQYIVELEANTITSTWAYQTRVHCANKARNRY